MKSADSHCNVRSLRDGNNNNTEDAELVEEIRCRMILHWNYRNLREFPPELLEHGEHVKEVYLKRNNLIKLPHNVGKLKQLTNIYLSGNQLRTLSAEVGELENLEVLDVSQNFLQSLPVTLGKLVKLQQLVLTQNELVSLPIELKHLRKLKFLEVSDNKLERLDEDLVKGWVGLEELCADRNPLLHLPRNLSNLTQLRTVSICKCDIRFLPAKPFSRCLSINRTHRDRGSRLHPANLDEQDEPGFHFRFDGNINLNYIPFWLIRLLGPRLESFGCNRPSTTPVPTNLPKVQYKCGSSPTFEFDGCLRKILPGKGIPSLLETSLRCLHANREILSNSKNESLWAEDLPRTLAKYLVFGPFAQCFQCLGPIFSELWPLFFKLQTDAVPMEISAMLHPHGAINAYNNYHMNQSLQNGFPQGFNYSYVSFCSGNCRTLFCKIVESSMYYPLHDFQLILRYQLSCEA